MPVERYETWLNQPEGGWLPIESAPKGPRIIIYSPVDGINTSHFEYGIWQGLPWRGNQADRDKAAPTHWQPLPAPPKEG